MTGAGYNQIMGGGTELGGGEGEESKNVTPPGQKMDYGAHTEREGVGGGETEILKN